MSVAMRALLVAGLVAAIAALATCHQLPLVAWTPQLVESSSYPWLFAELYAAWLALTLAPITWRRPILVVASLASLLTLSPAFAAVATAHALLTAAVLRSGIPRPLALVFLIGSVVVAVGLGNAGLGPEVRRLAMVFALGQTFRLFALFHASRVARPLSVVDTFLYLHLLPCTVIVPYMLCIPRVDRFRASLDRPRAADLTMLAVGAALAVSVHAVMRVFDPQTELIHASLAYDAPRAVGLALLSYPIRAVLLSLGPAWVLTGLMRLLGIDVDPPFDRPLASTSFLEWWRRWNMHFRDLLVDLFFYPVLLGRLRRRRRLALVAASVAVFVVGSTLFHLPNYMLTKSHCWQMNWGVFAENVVSCALVTPMLLVGRRRAPVRRRVLAVLSTWIVVFAAVRTGDLVNWSLHHRMP